MEKSEKMTTGRKRVGIMNDVNLTYTELNHRKFVKTIEGNYSKI